MANSKAMNLSMQHPASPMVMANSRTVSFSPVRHKSHILPGQAARVHNQHNPAKNTAHAIQHLRINVARLQDLHHGDVLKTCWLTEPLGVLHPSLVQLDDRRIVWHLQAIGSQIPFQFINPFLISILQEPWIFNRRLKLLQHGLHRQALEGLQGVQDLQLVVPFHLPRVGNFISIILHLWIPQALKLRKRNSAHHDVLSRPLSSIITTNWIRSHQVN